MRHSGQRRRDLFDRIKLWLEQKLGRVYNDLRSDREDRETYYEKRVQQYYDTYESWQAKDEDPHFTGLLARLFRDTARACDPARANFSPVFSEHSLRVVGLRAEVRSSSEELAELVRQSVSFELFIGDMPQVQFTVSSLEQGHAVNLAAPPTIPSRQSYYGDLHAPQDLIERLALLKDKVGPGSGWVSIRIMLDLIASRRVL